MKKLLVLFAGLVLAGTSYAYEIQPYTSAHFFNEEVGFGVGVDAKVPIGRAFEHDGLGAFVGIEYIGSEVDSAIESDLSILDAKAGFYYDFMVIPNFTITPLMNIDFMFINAEKDVDATNAQGATFGVDFRYDFTEDIAAFLGISYTFGSTRVHEAEIAVKNDLDNIGVRAGLTFRF